MIARQTTGPNAAFERGGVGLYRDTRSGFSRFSQFLKSSASGGVLAMGALASGLEPGIIDLTLPAALLYASWVLTRRVVLPFRLPATARRLDYNYPSPDNRKPRMAEGILYLGRDYQTGQQLWLSNEDGRQHVAVPGTTGAGKTSALLSLCANAFAWGSGFIFVDGKADNRLYAGVLAMARKFGREDDVLALNFLVASGKKDSATFNPFAWGNADVIRELLVSQIESNPNGGDKGGNHVFMARAVALLGALTPALVWMRDTKGVPIDIESIRFATELENIASLAINKVFRRRHTKTGVITEIRVDGKDDGIDEALLYPLRSYLGETGGYDSTKAYNAQKSDEPSKQHSFVVMHFSATFTQLAVSLGHIFKCEIGDIDMRDVVLNRRILVVNLPTLENSGETTASLGRLVVASLRNMMAQTLGADLEGHTAEIIDNKPHLAPTPFPVVFDEVGYYVVPGMDKMLAMGRGLGFMFYLGFQEVAGLRARIGDTMYSLLGNANLQILMRLQEGSETRKYIEQTAGDTHVTQASGFSSNDGGSFRENPHVEIRQVSRVNWTDLRALIEGEAIIVFGKERVYAKLFHADIKTDGELRLNRPMMLRPPEIGEIKKIRQRAEKTAGLLIKGRAAMQLQVAPSPTLEAMIHQFARRAGAKDAPSLDECAQQAILDLADVTPDAPPAAFPKAAGGGATGDVAENEHSAPMDHVAAPDGKPPPRRAPRRQPSPAIVEGLKQVSVASGASPAQARAETDAVMGMTEEALEPSGVTQLAPISATQLRGHMDALSTAFEAIPARATAQMRAAE